ncbi:SWI/SNF chromatin-remodeling complex subunit [Coemansia sp. RSA 1365]|nr:SWI/SNF chromatin-remodeling complex subunit [Coemansia sp. RSA 1365]
MSGFGTNGMGSGDGLGRGDEFGLNFSQAASMYMGTVGDNTGQGAGDTGLEELWNMGDDTNMFFNMDAFSSAPGSAIGNGTMGSSAAAVMLSTAVPNQSVVPNTVNEPTQALATSSGGGLDLAALGFDMSGASMDPEAWNMLMQGDPSMDDLFNGFGGTNPTGVPTNNPVAVNGSMGFKPVDTGTLAPSDLESLTKNASASLAQAPSLVKSPTPSAAKKPRQPKSKKSASKSDKPKPKSRKAATPKLKSPTPQPVSVGNPTKPITIGGSPGSDAVRKIQPKSTDGIAASPTPSVKSAIQQPQSAGLVQQTAQSVSSQLPGRVATPTSMINGVRPPQVPGQMFSPMARPPMAQQTHSGDGTAALAASMMQHSQAQQNTAQAQYYALMQQQQLQQQGLQQGMQGLNLQSLMHLQPAQRAQFIQHLQASGTQANSALLLALQQQHASAALSLAASQTMHTSATAGMHTSGTPGVQSTMLSPQQMALSGQLMRGANTTPTSNGLMTAAPQTGGAVGQPQQRTFHGTAIVMPPEYAGEVDRQMASYRAQMGVGADLTSVQQMIEQNMLARYMASQPKVQQTQPQVQTPVQPTHGQTGMPGNVAQHLALVSMLTTQHLQVLLAQLRTQMPQVFGNMPMEQFTQFLMTGQLAGNMLVNQLLVLLVHSSQQQRLHPGHSPVRMPLQQLPSQQIPPQQLQLQRAHLLQQQQLAANARPPNAFASPLIGQQQPANQRGVKRKSVNNSPTPGTPLQGVPLNKSPRVMASPATKAKPMNRSASTVSHQSPIVHSAATPVKPEPTTADSAKSDEKPSVSDVGVVATSETKPALSLPSEASAAAAQALLAGLTSPSQPPPTGELVSAPGSAPNPSAVSASGLTAAMMASLQNMTPAQRQLLILQQQGQLAAASAAAVPNPMVAAGAATPGSAPMPATSGATALGVQPTQQQIQQQQHVQAQMALMQMIPGFLQLPSQLQMALITLCAQQRTWTFMGHQLQTALQSAGLNPQQRNAYMMQLAQVQQNLNVVNQQLSSQVNLAKNLITQQFQQRVVTTGAVSNPAIVSTPVGTSAPVDAQTSAALSTGAFFHKDGSSRDVSESNLTQSAQTTQQQQQTAAVALSSATAAPVIGLSHAATSESQRQQHAATHSPATITTAHSAVSQQLPAQPPQLAQPPGQPNPSAQPTQPTQAVNFPMGPSLQPTVMTTDKIAKVLNHEQRVALGTWLHDAARIDRANTFKRRETAKYEEREAVYRKTLEEQRHHNNAVALDMRRDRELERHQLQQPLPWGPGYSGLGNGTTLPPSVMNVSGSGRQHTAPVTIVLPDQRHVAPGRLAPLRFSKKQLQSQAQRREMLVPIRLDIDADGYRLRDTFTWDLNNELIAPRQFALCLCSDMELPADSFVVPIVQAIDEQLDDYARYAQAFDEDEATAAGFIRRSLLDEFHLAATAEDSAALEEQMCVVKETQDTAAADDKDTVSNEEQDLDTMQETQKTTLSLSPLQQTAEDEATDGASQPRDSADTEPIKPQSPAAADDDMVPSTPPSAETDNVLPTSDEVHVETTQLVTSAAADGEIHKEDSTTEHQIQTDEDDSIDISSDELTWVDDELRVVIRIDVIIGHIALRDQIEWDIAPLLRPLVSRELRDRLQQLATADKESITGDQVPDSCYTRDDAVPQYSICTSENSKKTFSDYVREWVDGAEDGQNSTAPERVAHVLCAEKRLGGDFETSIAHAIREQLYAYAKSFLLAGYTYRPQMVPRKLTRTLGVRRLIHVDDAELARTVLPPVTRVIRDTLHSQTFAPLIAHLHTVDAERMEKDADREIRRKRRQGRQGRQTNRIGDTSGVDRNVQRTNRSMIPLPTWFDDDLPPDTKSFVEVPGEGAHFLDNHDARALHESSIMVASAPSLVTVAHSSFGSSLAGATDLLSSSTDMAANSTTLGTTADFSLALGSGAANSSHLLSRRYASGAANGFLTGLDIALATHGPIGAGGYGSVAGNNSVLSTPAIAGGTASPATPSTPLAPQQQQVRERLRNPTGRPRGRPSILEKSLREASAMRSERLIKLGHKVYRSGAIPGELTGRPQEELCARWRCMCCGLTPDLTTLIRRGPESMHSLCDDCGQVYADTRRFRDVSMEEINRNMSHTCGPLSKPDTDEQRLTKDSSINISDTPKDHAKEVSDIPFNYPESAPLSPQNTSGVQVPPNNVTDPVDYHPMPDYSPSPGP